jgi:signal transduction histidine kinase/DNA-binding response OmpR family regulator
VRALERGPEPLSPERRISELERSALWRWGAAAILMVALGVSVVTLYLGPVQAGESSLSEPDRVLSIGLCGLVALFGLYAISKERETRELRHRLIQAWLTEANLATQREAALETARLKSEFLSNMSHELRTPLTGIVGATELLLGSPLDPRQREFLETSKSCADALLLVINDILDFSSIDAQKLELDAIPFRFRECIAGALQPLAPRAEQKGLELPCEIAAEVPERLIGDPGRLRQVIGNLVGNAVKFTDRGEVVLRVALDTEMDRAVMLRFTVTDTGVGIPIEKQRTIFAPFSQADGSATREHGGTGLGLAIASRLVEMMGGQIGLESEPGRGSAFWFTVRAMLEPRAVYERARQPAVDLRGRRVLIVDDNATNRRIFSEMLEGWRLRPTAVPDAAGAREALRGALAAGEPFELVLLDSCMPGTDGLTLAAEVKADPDLRHALLVVLTSAAQPGDARRCREVGVTGYLPKPIMGTELLGALQAVLAEAGVPGAERPFVTRHWLRENRTRLGILLIEEEPATREFLVQTLERRGHRVLVAGAGRALSELLASESFDAVLIDFETSGPAGLQALATIRARDRAVGSPVRVIVLADAGGTSGAVPVGVAAVLRKPVQAGELFAAIDAATPDEPPVVGTDPAPRGLAGGGGDVEHAPERTAR